MTSYLQNNRLVEDALKDDIFPPVLVKLKIGSPDFRFQNGAVTSPLKTDTVTAHNGKYDITHAWGLAE